MAEGIKRKAEEIIGITSILAGIFSILILLTHSSWDRSPFTYTTQEIKNWGGIFGAYISDTLFNLVGIAAYLVPVAFVIYGTNRLLGLKKYRVKMAGITLLMIAVSIIMSLANDNFDLELHATATGLVGLTVGTILRKFLSVPGAYIIALSLVFSSIILLIPVTVESIVKKMKEQEKRKKPQK
ncbi:MAG: DNA translocase FtsK 4TM domain-containing protein, partial [Nitrospirota bacterium]